MALLLASAVVVIGLRLRVRRGVRPARISPQDFGLRGSGVAIVGFSSPFCAPCRAWEAALAEQGIAFTKVDVSERGALAIKYGIRQTPLLLAVRLPAGDVLDAYHGEPQPGDIERLRALAHTGADVGV